MALESACLFNDGFSRAINKSSIIFLLKVLVWLKIISHLYLCLGCVARWRGVELVPNCVLYFHVPALAR